MKYLAILLLLSACGGPHRPSPYAYPAMYMPTCHAPITGGICTGASF
jgi:hypothetical protein